MTTYVELYKALAIQPALSGFDSIALVAGESANTIQPVKLHSHFTAVNTETEDETIIEEEGRKFKYPTPRFLQPNKNPDELTLEQKLYLDYQFQMAKSALYELKNILRAAGVDVTSYDVRIKNDRLEIKIPQEFRSMFDMIYKNKLSADGFKARGTHRATARPFMKKLQQENSLKKNYPLLADAVEPAPRQYQSFKA